MFTLGHGYTSPVIFLVIFLALTIYLVVVLPVLAAWAANTGLRGDHDKAIKRLKFLAKMPTFGGDEGRLMVMYHLADRLVVAQRYEEAVTWYQRILALKSVPAELMTRVHSRYADCCEMLGQPALAVAHRQYSLNMASAKPGSFSTISAFGKQLERENRFEEACDYFENALATAQLSAGNRNTLRAKLAISASRAGRPETTIRAAEELIASNPKGNLVASMHRMAATAYINTGNLAAAENHYQKALSLAEASKDFPHQAEALAGLSGVYRNQGKVSQALDIAQKATTLCSPPTRVTNIYLVEVLMVLGRYQDAWQVITGVKENVVFSPDHKRTHAGVDGLSLARVCMEIGRPDDALKYLADGEAAFAGNAKMQYFINAFKSVLLAQAERPDEAFQIMMDTADKIATSCVGRGTKVDAYAYLCRAASILGDHDHCLQYLESYRELKPYPADYPRILFFAGESCLKVGNRDAAIRLFQEAAAACPEVIYAERARQALQESGG